MFREIHRMAPALLIAGGVVVARKVGILSDTDPLTLMLYKPALATIGFCAAHIVRQPAFPYLDLEAELRRGPGRAIASALLVGLIYVAFILGVTLGL